MKAYLVQTIDVWQNVELIGVFKDLKDAEKIIKENYTAIEDWELKEYMSTFSMVFDQDIELEDDEYIRIFGYILETDRPDGILLKYYE